MKKHFLFCASANFKMTRTAKITQLMYGRALNSRSLRMALPKISLFKTASSSIGARTQSPLISKLYRNKLPMRVKPLCTSLNELRRPFLDTSLIVYLKLLIF